MPVSGRTPTFLGIQALRGVAALMVTIHHLTLFWSSEFTGSQTAHEWSRGASGVDIFFVISGFVMTITATGKRTPTAFDFMRRRIIRIVPLYWLVTFAMCLKRFALALHPSLATHAAPPAQSLSYILACLFFIPARDASGGVIPILNAGWTLNLEMFFYVLFAIALLLKIRPIRFLTPVMILVTIVGVLHPANWPAIAEWADPMVIEFLAGVLLAYAVRGGFRINLKLAALLGLVGFGALLAVSPGDFALSRQLEWGIPAFLILVSAVILEHRYGRLWPTWLLKVGDASYSLYLVHVLLSGILIALGRKVLFAQTHEWVFVIGGLAISLIAAFLSYWLIEKNVTQWLSRKTSTALPVNIERTTTA